MPRHVARDSTETDLDPDETAPDRKLADLDLLFLAKDV